MHTFKHNDLTLEYTIQGTGIPFVFIHGLGGNTTQIQSVYQPIDGIQLIAINMQGHGNSEIDPLTLNFSSMADDVIYLLNLLQIEKAYFGGISMGVAISTNIAIRYPNYVMELICIRPAWTHKAMPKNVQQAYTDLAKALSENSKENFLTSIGWQIVSQTTNYTRNTFLTTFEEEINVKQWQKFSILPNQVPYTSIDDLKQLQIPTTIIACRNDFVHPYEYAEEYHQYIPNSILIEIPNKDVDPKLHNQIINTVLKERLKVNP